MKLNNIQAFNLYRWLDVPLHGSELRARNAFVKLIAPQYEAFTAIRKSKLEELADKDEAGKPIIDAAGYKISDENQKKFEELLDQVTMYEKFKDAKVIEGILNTKLSRGLGIEEGKIFEQVIAELSI